VAGGTLLQVHAATTQWSGTDDATVDTTSTAALDVAAVWFPAADGTPLPAHICNSIKFGLEIAELIKLKSFKYTCAPPCRDIKT